MNSSFILDFIKNTHKITRAEIIVQGFAFAVELNFLSFNKSYNQRHARLGSLLFLLAQVIQHRGQCGDVDSRIQHAGRGVCGARDLDELLGLWNFVPYGLVQLVVDDLLDLDPGGREPLLLSVPGSKPMLHNYIIHNRQAR